MVMNQLRSRRLPVILQAEATECGLVCLAMIAAFYGSAADLHDLRQRFGASVRGWSLRRLLDVGAHRVSPRARCASTSKN